MTTVDFDTTGLRRLAADISAADEVNTRRASAALRKTALDIEADAKIFAPVDTGALKNSITSDISEFHAEIGPTVDYAHYVENGTSRMRGQPYMRPAADRRIPPFRRRIAEIGGDIL